MSCLDATNSKHKNSPTLRNVAIILSASQLTRTIVEIVEEYKVAVWPII